MSWLRRERSTEYTRSFRDCQAHFGSTRVKFMRYYSRTMNEVAYLNLNRYCKNALFGKVGRSASEDVFLHLVKSKCLPILLYCLEVCPLTKSDLRSLDFTVTRLLMKLFRTSNRDIINECCSRFYFKLPSEILPVRFDRFLCKLQQ